MSADGLSDAEVKAVLQGSRRIAVVGASNKPARASYGVMQFLLRQGFEVVPVNPGLAGQEVLGLPVVASLQEAGRLDMVDLFRNAAEVGPPVAEAIRLGAKTIWMQLGVVNADAAAAARAAGLTVVMDRCPAIEMPRLGLEREN
jgi:predicted CoA-binding protein